MYVALGEDAFADELAAKLNLSNKYFRFGLEENYLDMVAKADLVTVKLDNGSYGEFACAQIKGAVADILRSHDDLMTLYNHALIGSYVQEGLDMLHIDINAEAVELEWNKYLDEESREMLETVLAQFKAELVKAGVPEYYYIELQGYVDQALEDYGLAGLPGIAVDIDPIVIPVVDLAAYALENVLYAYARFTNDMTSIISNIHAVSPDATVVFMGVTNPLEGFELDLSEFGVDFVDYSDCVMAVDVLVEMLNVQIYGAALVTENVIFVHDNDADAIYDALHVYCDHVYDDCLDAECNRCLAVRVVLGHSFTNYVSNNDATCTEDGTETAHCEYCGASDTRTDIGSALGHDWKAATCTDPKTCKTCGKTQGQPAPHKWANATCTESRKCTVCGKVDGEALGHNFGRWITDVEPTYEHGGEEHRTCSRCGHVERNYPPALELGFTITDIIITIVAAIVVAAAIGAVLIYRDRKKDYVNGGKK